MKITKRKNGFNFSFDFNPWPKRDIVFSIWKSNWILKIRQFSISISNRKLKTDLIFNFHFEIEIGNSTQQNVVKVCAARAGLWTLLIVSATNLSQKYAFNFKFNNRIKIDSIFNFFNLKLKMKIEFFLNFRFLF